MNKQAVAMIASRWDESDRPILTYEGDAGGRAFCYVPDRHKFQHAPGGGWYVTNPLTGERVHLVEGRRYLVLKGGERGVLGEATRPRDRLEAALWAKGFPQGEYRIRRLPQRALKVSLESFRTTAWSSDFLLYSDATPTFDREAMPQLIWGSFSWGSRFLSGGGVGQHYPVEGQGTAGGRFTASITGATYVVVQRWGFQALALNRWMTYDTPVEVWTNERSSAISAAAAVIDKSLQFSGRSHHTFRAF